MAELILRMLKRPMGSISILAPTSLAWKTPTLEVRVMKPVRPEGVSVAFGSESFTTNSNVGMLEKEMVRI